MRKFHSYGTAEYGTKYPRNKLCYSSRCYNKWRTQLRTAKMDVCVRSHQNRGDSDHQKRGDSDHQVSAGVSWKQLLVRVAAVTVEVTKTVRATTSKNCFNAKRKTPSQTRPKISFMWVLFMVLNMFTVLHLICTKVCRLLVQTKGCNRRGLNDHQLFT